MFIIDLLFVFGYMSYNEYWEIIVNGYVLKFNGIIVFFGFLIIVFVKG